MWLFVLISLPYGIYTSGLAVLLSFVLRREGTSVSSIANEVALIAVPATIFFLWGPLSDFWLRRRSWFVVAYVTAGVAVALAFQLHSLAEPAAVALLFVGSCASMLASAAKGGMAAELISEDGKTRVASMIEVGILSGGALGGGGLVLLAQHLSRSAVGLCAGALLVSLAAPALFIDEPPVKPLGGLGNLGHRIAQIGTEFKLTFLRWSALPALLLLAAPMSSGAAIGLIPGIAVDFGISGNQIAWLNGVAGALLMAGGALLAAVIPARYDIRVTYTVAGLANALAIGVLCVGPTRPATYLIGTSLFLLTVGTGLALYMGLVLRFVGPAGASGSTRYALTASIGTICVVYMEAADGLGAKWFGPRGLPGMDMVLSGGAAITFLIYFAAVKRKRHSVDSAELAAIHPA
jgi:PAT family beta-lactamase induction signal transducer AmpG